MPLRTQAERDWLAAGLDQDAETCEAEAQFSSPPVARFARSTAAVLRADAVLLRGGITPNRYQT